MDQLHMEATDIWWSPDRVYADSRWTPGGDHEIYSFDCIVGGVHMESRYRSGVHLESNQNVWRSVKYTPGPEKLCKSLYLWYYLNPS